MLSFGIDASRAFCTIVRKVGLASASPPPLRAATSICRASRANCFPRAASAAPLACLIECHLECPLISSRSRRFSPGRCRSWSPAQAPARAAPASLLAGTPVSRSLRSCYFTLSVQEPLVQPEVARELGMETGHDDRTLTRQHRHAVVYREHVDVLAHGLDARRADEDAGKWAPAESGGSGRAQKTPPAAGPPPSPSTARSASNESR